jgi:hypothetical protein
VAVGMRVAVIIAVVAAAATTPVLLSLPHGLPSIVIFRAQPYQSSTEENCAAVR